MKRRAYIISCLSNLHFSTGPWIIGCSRTCRVMFDFSYALLVDGKLRETTDCITEIMSAPYRTNIVTKRLVMRKKLYVQVRQ